MNTLQINRPGRTVSQASIIGFRGDVYRRIGDMRAVTLGRQVEDADTIFGVAKALQGSFEESFGKIANDIEMDADREMEEFNDHILGAFSRA